MRAIILSLLLLCVPGLAKAELPYTVHQVAVELPLPVEGPEASPPAATPREAAVSLAADKALRSLLRLMTTEENWAQTDALLAQVPASTLLERFNIVQENSLPPYSVVVDLYFKRDALRQLLADRGISFVDTKQEAVLVVPVYVVGPNPQLFEEDNPWALALQKALAGPHLAQFNLPTGDYTDMMTLTPHMALLGVAEAITALGERYKAGMVLVPIARVIYRGGQRVLQVQSAWYGSQNWQPVSFELSMEEAKQPDVLQEAARKLIDGVESQWRHTNTVAVNRPQSLVAFLNITHVAGLEETLKKLNAMATVQQAFLRSLTKQEAYIQIDYYGDSTTLTDNLRAQNMWLVNQEGRWILSPSRPGSVFSSVNTEAPRAVVLPEAAAAVSPEGSLAVEQPGVE